MSFNSVGQYTANHKGWDHVGNIIPNVEHSEGERPAGEFMPAAWLPVKFFDKFYENWITVMPGKIVAFDPDGRVCPAQYGLAGATITYTSDDVTAGVIDIRTGAALLSAATGTFNVADVDDFMGRGESVDLGTAVNGGNNGISAPVGVAPYPYLQWAGNGDVNDDGNNPAYYRQHNYNMQHRVAILCDYVLELPVVPAKTSTESLTEASYANNVSTMTALANLPVAHNTVRTPTTFANHSQTDASTRFVNQVDTAANVKAAGDWWIDETTGVIKVYTTGTLGATPYYVTYYNYASSPTGSNVSAFACVLGNVTPGCFLKCNADSNWVVDTSASLTSTMGQVLDVEVFPRDGLDKVRTAYLNLNSNAAGGLPGTAGQLDQMPGSATGGVSAKIHYAGASNRVCHVNLVSR